MSRNGGGRERKERRREEEEREKEEERQGRGGDMVEDLLGQTEADKAIGFHEADCRPRRPTGCGAGWARPYPPPARRGGRRLKLLGVLEADRACSDGVLFFVNLYKRVLFPEMNKEILF